jgi:hypothetical protein
LPPLESCDGSSPSHGPNRRTSSNCSNCSHELLELLLDAGHQRRGGDRADARQLHRRARPRVGFGVRGDALVAPREVDVEFDPRQQRVRQRQPREAGRFVSRVLAHAGQRGAQPLGALGKQHQAERGEQAATAVDAARALFLPSLPSIPSIPRAAGAR